MQCIVEGDYGFGEWIVEICVVDEFGVSQVFVCEVLWELEIFCFVVLELFRGVCVKEACFEEVLEVYLV